jgi:hypothetical protein
MKLIGRKIRKTRRGLSPTYESFDGMMKQFKGNDNNERFSG